MNIIHGSIGGLIGMVILQAQDEPAIATALKAIIALLIGLCGTVLSKWIEKKFPSN